MIRRGDGRALCLVGVAGFWEVCTVGASRRGAGFVVSPRRAGGKVFGL